MENQPLSANGQPMLNNKLTVHKSANPEGLMMQNLHQYFQLATMFVTKLNDLETKKEKVILVADDEPLTIQLIKEYFQDAHFPCSVIPASNGCLAYNMAVSKIPDLIITDWLMPEYDGIELIQHLKSNEETRRIPVIMVTGAFFTGEEENKVLAAGAIDFVKKPIDQRDLIHRVKAALALHDALQEIREEEAEVEIRSITEIGEVIQSKRNSLLELKSSMERLQSELDSKHQKLILQTELLIHSKNVKSNLISAVSKLQPYLTNEGRAKFFSVLKQIHWELNDEAALQVEKDFDQLHAGFYNSLQRGCPSITKNEKRLCAYLRMNHGASDIAKITNRSLNSINVALARLRMKLQLASSKDLRSYLIEVPS